MTYSFAAETLSETKLISSFEAWERTIDAVWGGNHWRSINGKSHAVDRRQCNAAILEAQTLILDALHTAALKAWVHPLGSSFHYRLPPEIWMKERDGSTTFQSAFLAGKLVRMPDMDVIEEVLDGLPIWVDKQACEHWLSGQKRRRGAPTKYDWAGFTLQAKKVLEDEGGLSAAFTKSDLDRKLVNWFDERWPKTPPRSSRFAHLSEAINDYEAARVR